MTAPTIAPGLVRPAPCSARSRARRMEVRSFMIMSHKKAQNSQKAIVHLVPFCGYSSCSQRDSCREQRLYEIICGEFDEIIHFFAHTDETNGNFQVFRDGCHNAALGRAVEF